MPMRWNDWLGQARRDLAHARHSTAAGDNEWACFARQQTAEKAVKAVFQRSNREARGHSVTALLNRLAEEKALAPDLMDAARNLDQHYIPARYPNGFASGIPGDY